MSAQTEGRIYLDNHATTPVDPRVAEVVYDHMVNRVGNASSLEHSFGKDARNVVKNARREIALLVSAEPEEVIFTSGATESINIAIQGFTHVCHKGGLGRPVRIAAMALEHKAVLDTIGALEEQGLAEHVSLPVDGFGRLDVDSVASSCADGVDLLCMMAANNEIGNIYPIEEIGEIARGAGIPLLCDATQLAGRRPVEFEASGITLMALSAHKIYGPQGVGALIRREGFPLLPISYGGQQERGLRPGTLNLPGIAGFGKAALLRRREMAQDGSRIAVMRETLLGQLRASVPGLVLNGDEKSRLAGNLHFSVPGVPNQAVLARVEDRLAISTGSACSSGIESPSHVLAAITSNQELQRSAIRIGIGKFNQMGEVKAAAALLINAIADVRRCIVRSA